MAYTDAHRPPDARALAGATALQLAIGALVITGLTAVDMTPIDPPQPNPTAVFEPIPQPPPPEPETVVEPNIEPPAAPDVYRPEPIRDFFELPPKVPTTSERLPIEDILPVPIPGPATGTPGPTGTPSAKPSFKPVAAKPLTSPATWFSTDDYPSAAIRRELEGTVGYSLQISASGKVESCTVTRSSGHSSLDQATCRLLPRRGKFEPARDSSGAKVRGTFSAEILWQLP